MDVERSGFRLASADGQSSAAKADNQGAVFGNDVDIVDLASASSTPVGGSCGKHLSNSSGSQEIYRCARRQRLSLIVDRRVRSVGHCGISQRKKQPAMADAETIDHVVSHGHGER